LRPWLQEEEEILLLMKRRMEGHAVPTGETARGRERQEGMGSV
jgi:hypothetical protein